MGGRLTGVYHLLRRAQFTVGVCPPTLSTAEAGLSPLPLRDYEDDRRGKIKREVNAIKISRQT